MLRRKTSAGRYSAPKRTRGLLGDEETEELEKSVFGQASFSAVLGEDTLKQKQESAAHALAVDEEDDEEGEREEKTEAAAAPQPAWEDADDATYSVDIAAATRSRKLRQHEGEQLVSGMEYAQRLRAQFEKLHGRPSWAEISADKQEGEPGAAKHGSAGAQAKDGEEEEEEEPILRTAGKMVKKGGRLLATNIDMSRVENLNEQGLSDCAVQRIQFHPHSPVAFTVGLDKTLRIFQVDGKDNARLQSVFIPDMPINCAAWTPDGSEIILSGRRGFFYSYDVASGAIRKTVKIQGRYEKSLHRFWLTPDGQYIAFAGHDGTVIFVSNKSKQWAYDLKMNGAVYQAAFTPDGSNMLSAGAEGQVYVWDVRARDCVHVFTDEGSLTCSALAVSPNGRRIACGSDSGVVNIYDESCMHARTPKPLKAVMNLTTEIDTLSFSHDSQLLAFGSRFKKESFRLLHVPSTSVYANWPTRTTPIGYVHCASFSPRSGYLGIGNAKGKALLYRMSHYSSY